MPLRAQQAVSVGPALPKSQHPSFRSWDSKRVCLSCPDCRSWPWRPACTDPGPLSPTPAPLPPSPVPAGWEPMVVSVAFGGSVCPLVVVLRVVAVLLAGGLVAEAPGAVRSAVVLGTWLVGVGVPVVGRAGVGWGRETMVCRIQPLSLVTRA